MTGPLDGVRIVELAGLGPGPYGVMLLADLGAEVVRVDRVTPAVGMAEWTVGLSRGRRSISLDLKNPSAVVAMLDLIETADVFVESNRPGVAERLGIGPEVCCAGNPGLIYARMTGWGQDGPLASTAGHDIGYIALAGALFDIGRPDSPPPPPQAYVGDYGGGGTFLAIGVLAALFERARSGQGQVIDAAVLDGATSLTAFSHGLLQLGLWGSERGSTIADGSYPYYDTYGTLDDEFVAVGAIEPKFYATLLEVLGLSSEEYPQDDRESWPRLRAALRDSFGSRTREECERLFAGRDACVVPVLRLDEAPQHPHNIARQLFVDVGGHLQPGVAPRLSRTPGTAGAPAPIQGADSLDILCELGYSQRRIAELLASKATMHPTESQH
jgi:alpha-methylacyl-CoA racemase